MKPDFSIDCMVSFSATIETLINTALDYDPASRQQLATLSDVLAITLEAPSITTSVATSITKSVTTPITFYCYGTEAGIRILSHCEKPVTTQLTGSPLALLSLLKQPTTLANSGVELTGNLGLLQQWQELIQQLDIDWEDAISTLLGQNLFGDIVGTTTINSIRSSAAWAKQRYNEHMYLLKEYLPEELRIVPSKTELHSFYSQVNDVVLHTDRLSARLAQLTNRLNKKQKETSAHKETPE